MINTRTMLFATGGCVRTILVVFGNWCSQPLLSDLLHAFLALLTLLDQLDFCVCSVCSCLSFICSEELVDLVLSTLQQVTSCEQRRAGGRPPLAHCGHIIYVRCLLASQSTNGNCCDHEDAGADLVGHASDGQIASLQADRMQRDIVLSEMRNRMRCTRE